jgi:hypothetical protein
MDIQVTMKGSVLNKDSKNSEDFISMKELDSAELKINHLGLYLKTNILSIDDTLSIEDVNTAIDRVNLALFINGICEGNASIRTLLTNNIVYELSRVGIINISVSNISKILYIEKSKSNNS